MSHFMSRFLDWVERVGNRLPDPVTIFFAGALLVLAGSHVAAWLGWSAELTTVSSVATADGSFEQVIQKTTVEAKSLLVGEGLRWVWLNAVKNFTDFHPLGVVLVCMLGIGVAERSGLVTALLKLIVVFTPKRILTPVVIFAGITSNVAGDAGYVVLPLLAAAIYAKVGRSPLVGLAAVFAGVAAGFSANLLPSALDPMLAKITQEGASLLDRDYHVAVLSNYWFMVISTFVLTLTGWGVTRWLVEPRFDQEEVRRQIGALAGSGVSVADEGVTAAERRGLVAATVVLALVGAGVMWLILVPGAPLHGAIPKGAGEVPIWSEAIVPIMFVLFLLPGIAFGIAAHSIRNDRDVAKMMGRTMADMGMYVVLAFAAAQFVAWFRESNLGTLTALAGVDLLGHLDVPPTVLVLLLVLAVAVLNLFLGSASAKWALLAPVLVPVFMGLGIAPELTQAAYRVGDSCTNPIAPLNAYLVVVLVALQRCQSTAGIGSLISLMLPYSLVFTLVWAVLLAAFVYFGIPLGPGAALLVTPAVG